MSPSNRTCCHDGGPLENWLCKNSGWVYWWKKANAVIHSDNLNSMKSTKASMNRTTLCDILKPLFDTSGQQPHQPQGCLDHCLAHSTLTTSTPIDLLEGAVLRLQMRQTASPPQSCIEWTLLVSHVVSCIPPAPRCQLEPAILYHAATSMSLELRAIMPFFSNRLRQNKSYQTALRLSWEGGRYIYTLHYVATHPLSLSL